MTRDAHTPISVANGHHPPAARCVIAAVVALLGTGARGALLYSVKDLGTVSGGSTSFAAGYNTLNANGQVAGYSNTSAGSPYHAIRSSINGAAFSLTEFATTVGDSSYGYSINLSGQVAGAYTTQANGATHAIRYNATGTGTTDLGLLPNGTNSYAYGINTSGQVVGYSSTTGKNNHAFRTAANSAIDANSDLGTLGGTASYAYAINATGQVTGGAWTIDSTKKFDDEEHVFRTTATGNITGGSGDLGTLGGTMGLGYAINASGQVAGASYIANDVAQHAFRTTDTGGVAGTDLGTLGGTNSFAMAINTAGQTVGYSFMPGATPNHAFFVDTTGGMIDLNTLLPANTGWVLNAATGINDLSQISGYGTINNQTHAFLLTLTPEPTTIGIIGITAIFALSRRRAKR